MTTVGHCKKTGDKSNGVYVGRPSPFGNPYATKPSKHAAVRASSREEAIERYREYFYRRIETDPGFRDQVHELRGKKLLCWCHPKPCHADIIAEYLNHETSP